MIGTLPPPEGWRCPTCGRTWAPWWPGPCCIPTTSVDIGTAITNYTCLKCGQSFPNSEEFCTHLNNEPECRAGAFRD